MEENKSSKNPLTHKRNFRAIFKILSLSPLAIKTYEYVLYQYLVDEWICQFRPYKINFSVLREEILRTIINHHDTLKKTMEKLVRLGLLEYDGWAGYRKAATVTIKDLSEDGFNVDDFCELLLKDEKRQDKEQPTQTEQEKPESTKGLEIPTLQKTEEDMLLVSHLIGKLRAKAVELDIEVGKNKGYELFYKGENNEAAHRILEMMKIKRMGEEVTTTYIEAEVNRIAIVAQQKLLLTSFNPFAIALKSNVFGLTERKKKGTQIPKAQKAKTQIPSKKENIQAQ